MKLDKILSNIKFQNIKFLSKKEILEIRNIRNEWNIRKNMTISKKIFKKDHQMWHDQIKSSKTNYFYGIKYDKELVGGLGLKGYSKNKLIGEWAFYISEKKIFIGLGATIEFKALKLFFEKFKMSKLCCYVLEHNLEVIKLHKKFGFRQISFKAYAKNYSMAKKVSNAIYFLLEKNEWKNIKKQFLKKYF